MLTFLVLLGLFFFFCSFFLFSFLVLLSTQLPLWDLSLDSALVLRSVSRLGCHSEFSPLDCHSERKRRIFPPASISFPSILAGGFSFSWFLFLVPLFLFSLLVLPLIHPLIPSATHPFPPISLCRCLVSPPYYRIQSATHPFLWLYHIECTS